MTAPPLTFNAWLRYDIIKRVLTQLLGIERVLEVGAGQGALGARLAARYDYVGLEPDELSFARASERIAAVGRGRVIPGDVSALDRGELFDLICAFEVLEHIQHDVEELKTWRQYLRSGGWLLISVPAFRHRFGPADHMVGHYRRYDHRDIAPLLRAAGFSAPRIWTYGFPLGYLLEAARNAVARRRGASPEIAGRTAVSGRILQPSGSTGWITQVITTPFRVLQRPFVSSHRGTGLIVLARNPAS